MLVDDQRRLAAFAQRPQTVPDLLAHDRAEPFGRFVEDHETRAEQQGAPDREHLLLAAGDLAAERVRAVGQPWE
jgi:hypothetical protein